VEQSEPATVGFGVSRPSGVFSALVRRCIGEARTEAATRTKQNADFDILMKFLIYLQKYNT
jgi:hypothetical protein